MGARSTSLGPLVLALAVLIAAPGCGKEEYVDRFAEDEIAVPDDLFAISAVGGDHLWAAGYFGALYRTRDAGRSWQKLRPGTTRSIYDISFADERNGWAVGRIGFIIHTIDGGDEWELQTIPRDPPRHILSVFALDANRAWAVGDWGGRYYTTDAGRTWLDRSFLLDESHPAFKYLTDAELEAHERGEPIYDDIYLNDIFFTDEQHGWIVGEYGFIFRTEDGGETWQKGKIVGAVSFEDVVFPELDADVPKSVWGTLFDAAEVLVDKQYLRVRVEGFLTRDELARTKDTFLADERAEDIRDFLEGEGVGQDRIRIQNRTPLDAEDIDLDAFVASKLAGEPIARIEVIETPFLFDVKFRDPQHGLVAGLGGVILNTDDGGRTWTYRDTDSRLALFGVGLGDGHVIAVGERGERRVSTDEGKTWSMIEEASDAFPEDVYVYMRDIEFGDSRHGWIVGAGGLVLRSEDGGRTWERMELRRRAPGAASEAGE